MNLKQLAETLGLSQTTVSRALNGYPEVGKATRERVLAAARQYNYRPNTRAKSLATGRAMAIGHVIPLSTKHEMVNPIFGDFVAGAGETYHKNGYDMVLSVVDDGDEERAYRDLQSRGTVDGVIVHGPRMADRRITLLHEIGLPFVVHGRASEIDVPYSWVDVNNQSAFRRATDFLVDLGHTRIGLINGLEDMDYAHRRRKGYDKSLMARRLTADPALLRSGEMTETYGHDSAAEMLAQRNPPTALLVSGMIPAIGARRAIDEAGLRMGQDVSVITFDDDLSYLGNGGDVPIFTALRSSVREAGRRSAEILLDIIANPGNAPESDLFEADLVVGNSTGPASNKR